QVVDDGLGGDDSIACVGRSNRVLGGGDLVGAATKLGGVAPVGGGIRRFYAGEPFTDRVGDRLGHFQVVEDMLVGRFPVRRGRAAQRRIGVDGVDAAVGGQHLVDPRVVPATVVD